MSLTLVLLMSDPAANPHKEGLQWALDLTKFTLVISGAAIAFFLSSDSLQYAVTTLQRTLITLSLIGFGISAVSGILVLLEGGTQIASASYNLNSPYIKVPGQINLVSLGAAFFFASLFVFVVIWWQVKPE